MRAAAVSPLLLLLFLVPVHGQGRRGGEPARGHAYLSSHRHSLQPLPHHPGPSPDEETPPPSTPPPIEDESEREEIETYKKFPVPRTHKLDIRPCLGQRSNDTGCALQIFQVQLSHHPTTVIKGGLTEIRMQPGEKMGKSIYVPKMPSEELKKLVDAAIPRDEIDAKSLKTFEELIKNNEFLLKEINDSNTGPPSVPVTSPPSTSPPPKGRMTRPKVFIVPDPRQRPTVPDQPSSSNVRHFDNGHIDSDFWKSLAIVLGAILVLFIASLFLLWAYVVYARTPAIDRSDAVTFQRSYSKSTLDGLGGYGGSFVKPPSYSGSARVVISRGTSVAGSVRPPSSTATSHNGLDEIGMAPRASHRPLYSNSFSFSSHPFQLATATSAPPPFPSTGRRIVDLRQNGYNGWMPPSFPPPVPPRTPPPTTPPSHYYDPAPRSAPPYTTTFTVDDVPSMLPPPAPLEAQRTAARRYVRNTKGSTRRHRQGQLAEQSQPLRSSEERDENGTSEEGRGGKSSGTSSRRNST